MPSTAAVVAVAVHAIAVANNEGILRNENYKG